MDILTTGKSKKDSNEKCFNMPSHGLVMLGATQAVPVPGYIDTTGLPVQASSVSVSQAAFGLIRVKDQDTLCYYPCGSIEKSDGHGFVAGEILYLQDDGSIGNTPGTNAQKIYEVIDDECLLSICSEMCCTKEINKGDPPTTFEGKSVFDYTGSDQVYNIPPTAEWLRVIMWGAGGGGPGFPTDTTHFGGGGGCTESLVCLLDIGSPSTLDVVVGQGGEFADITGKQYGGGGIGGGPNQFNGSPNNDGASGGGYSGIFNGIVNQANAVLIAGGGGGSGWGTGTNQNGSGGGGGGLVGQAGTSSHTNATGGLGGNQASGGLGGTVLSNPNDPVTLPTPGSALCGGTGGFGLPTTTFGNGSGGGGGGYYGGGGGATGGVGTNSAFETGGGGGSGYISPFIVSSSPVTTTASLEQPPCQTDTDYTLGIATGGGAAQNGGNGKVVIEWSS